MKSHIQLKYTDLNDQEVILPLFLSYKKEGWENLESYEVTKEGINTYLQFGCTLLKGNILRYIYNDFSGGDMQETFMLQDVSYKTKNTKIIPQTTANSSSLIYLNNVDDTSTGTKTGYVIDKVLVIAGTKYVLLRNKDNYTHLYIDGIKGLLPGYLTILTIFNKNNEINILYRYQNKFYHVHGDSTDLLSWTHCPIRAEYSEPYLYTIDSFGSIRLFSIIMLSGFLPIRINLIENNVAHVDKVYSFTNESGTHLTGKAPARINEPLKVLESEGANLLEFIPYNNNNILKTDTLVIEVYSKNSDEISDSIIRGFTYDNSITIPKTSIDAFGYDTMLNSGQCEKTICKRLEASTGTVEPDDLLVTTGTYEEGEDPVEVKGWIDNISEVEVPISSIFKIYWKSDPDFFFYYQFFLGEEIDLGIRTPYDDFTTDGYLPKGLVIVKITDSFASKNGFSVGDKWMLPMYKDESYSDGQIQLEKNVIPGSVVIQNDPSCLNDNENYYYSSVSQTHHLPIIRPLMRNKIIDEHDISFSLPNTRLVINRPEFGGRIGPGVTLNYSYALYNETPIDLKIIPGELANKHISFGENVFDHSIFPETDMIVLSNSEKHINLRIQPKNTNQLNSFPGPNATLIQREDDIIFNQVITGEILSTKEIDGQIFISSYDGTDTILYMINRTGLRTIETVKNEKAYLGISFEGTLIYVGFTTDNILKVYILGGEKIYEEAAEESNISFQKIENAIYITHNSGIICIQSNTTNNYYHDYNGEVGIAGILTGNIIKENLEPLTVDYNKGMLRTSFFTFGKDGGVNKEIVSVSAKCINETSQTITLFRDHGIQIPSGEKTFNSLSVQVEAEADAIESIIIDFKPQFNSSTQHIFTIIINPDIRDIDKVKIEPELTHQSVIDNLIAMPTTTEYILTDIDNVEHTVELEKIQIKGTPVIRNTTEPRDQNAYLATFYMRELH